MPTTGSTTEMLPSSWSVTSRPWAAAALAMRSTSSGSSAANVTSTNCRTGARRCAAARRRRRWRTRRASTRSARTRCRTGGPRRRRGTPSVISANPCSAMEPSSAARHCGVRRSSACHARNRHVKRISILHRCCESFNDRLMPADRADAHRAGVRAMRSDILSGRLTPGAKLPFAELAARYGGSTSVIREGLTRLVEQGLVQAEPQHGFRVGRCRSATSTTSPRHGARSKGWCCASRSPTATSSGSRRSSPPTTRSNARRWRHPMADPMGRDDAGA